MHSQQYIELVSLVTPAFLRDDLFYKTNFLKMLLLLILLFELDQIEYDVVPNL